MHEKNVDLVFQLSHEMIYAIAILHQIVNNERERKKIVQDMNHT
jgi:hypothetical protein